MQFVGDRGVAVSRPRAGSNLPAAVMISCLCNEATPTSSCGARLHTVVACQRDELPHLRSCLSGRLLERPPLCLPSCPAVMLRKREEANARLKQ